MAKVYAEVILEIDETEEERIVSNAEDFLEKALVESVSGNTIESNSIREKPLFRIGRVER